MSCSRSPLFAVSALALAAAQAVAQTAPANASATAEGADLQSVTVTARKVDERIIDVPLTIRAIGGRDLAERGITNITELMQITPGMSYSPDFGRTAERPVVRGISALREQAPQPVSVFVDGLFLRDGALSLVLDDAQRVEIIKGPQSALYGRSTYAGAINYITVKPGNEFKGTASATLAQAGERSVFGAVTVPLAKDLASMRIRARHHQFGGQYTNAQTGNKIGDERTDAAGVLLSLTPTADLDLRFTLDHSKIDDGFFAGVARSVPTQQPAGTVTGANGSTNVANGGTCNGRTISIVGNNAAGLPDPAVAATAAARANGWPCGPATFSGTTVNRNEADLANFTDPSNGENYGDIAGLKRTINRAGFTADYDFGGGYTLTSQTGFTRQYTELGADQSYNGTRFAATGASWTSFNKDRLRYYSQELRLASPQNQALTWLVGAFFYDERTEGFSSGVIARSGANVVAAPLRPVSPETKVNSAPFARVQYEIDKSLRVSLEGRYNRETVGVEGLSLGTATVTAGTCVAGQSCAVVGKRTFTDFSPRVTLDWKPMKDTLVYAQVAKGSKSGGFNTAAGIPSDRFAYDGEDITAAELGVKGVLAGGTVGFSAALYRNNVDGLQLSNIITIISPFSANPAAPTPTTTTIVNNVGKARTQGLEFDLSFRATDWLTLLANYAYTDAKALQGTEITNGTVFGGNQSVAGFTLPRTPKHSAAASMVVDMPVGGGSLRATGRVDVSYQSRRYAEIQNMIWADPSSRVNLSGGVRAKDWSLRLWVKNATNDDTSLNGFRYLDPTTFRRSAVDFLPRLRQVGVTGTYDF